MYQCTNVCGCHADVEWSFKVSGLCSDNLIAPYGYVPTSDIELSGCLELL